MRESLFSASTSLSRVSAPQTAIGVGVALMLASSGMVGQARAAEADAATRPGLKIVIVGPQDAADLLSVAIAPLVTELEPVTWRQLHETTPISDAGLEPLRGAVRIWIDAHRTGTVTIVGFSSRGAPRVRSVEAPDLTPVVAETISQIVRETAVALIGEPASAEADVTIDQGELDASRASRHAVIEAPPRAEPAATKLSTRSGASLAFGGVFRNMGGFSHQVARGVSISMSAWLQHAALRSFATLSFDWVENATGDLQLVAVSLVPTVGISWRPQKVVDLRTSIGVGADRINFGGSAWYPVARATASANAIVLARFEVTMALMIDAVESPDLTHRGWQPAALLGIGWW